MFIKRSAEVEEISVERGLDTPEFIRRLAEDQRIKSGSDLPLSCFIEQVKMQLKGHPANETNPTPADRIVKRSGAMPAHHTSELFQTWAMPEQAGGTRTG